MCTRFYILPGSPDLEYIMAAARKSPLLRRFVRRRQMELLQKKGLPDTGGTGNAAVQTDLFSEMNGGPGITAVQMDLFSTPAAGAGSSLYNSEDSDGILKTCGEIRPTDIVPVLAPDKGGNAAVYPMQWGFRLPAGNGQRAGQAKKGMLLVNARVETAAEKVTFRAPGILSGSILRMKAGGKRPGRNMRSVRDPFLKKYLLLQSQSLLLRNPGKSF